MNNFKTKAIWETETLGDRLKQIREENNIDLEKAGGDLQIPTKYLQYLEKGAYNFLPGEVYTKNFLKKYALFLGVDEHKVLHLYDQEQKVFKKIKESPEEEIKKRFSFQILSKFHFFIPTKLLKYLASGLVIGGLLFYLGLGVRNIFSPPLLEITNPPTDTIITERIIEVAGRTEKESKIYINGQEIMGDENGHFQETINLQEGVNIIKISAQKEHSQSNTVYKKIIVE